MVLFGRKTAIFCYPRRILFQIFGVLNQISMGQTLPGGRFWAPQLSASALEALWLGRPARRYYKYKDLWGCEKGSFWGPKRARTAVSGYLGRLESLIMAYKALGITKITYFRAKIAENDPK